MLISAHRKTEERCRNHDEQRPRCGPLFPWHWGSSGWRGGWWWVWRRARSWWVESSILHEHPFTSVRILDDFIDHQDCGQPEDAPGPLILENQLPDRDKEGLNDLLAGILGWSRNLAAQEARYDSDMDSDDEDTPATVAACLPTHADYPLLRVRCIVSLNHYDSLIFYWHVYYYI